MSNETQASNFPGYFATNNGDQLAASIALASLTKESPLDEVAANGICSLRSEVKDVEANIKQAIHNQSLTMGTEFCGVNKNIGDAECSILKNAADISHRNTIQLNSVERDLQNRIHENRQIINKNTDDRVEILRTQMFNFERMTAEKFCEVKSQVKDSERNIIDRLSADKLDEKNEIIDSLRHERNHDKWHSQFALQNQELSYLKQLVNSVEQNQKLSNKVVQFGAGNFATPVNTQNQA